MGPPGESSTFHPRPLPAAPPGSSGIPGATPPPLSRRGILLPPRWRRSGGPQVGTKKLGSEFGVRRAHPGSCPPRSKALPARERLWPAASPTVTTRPAVPAHLRLRPGFRTSKLLCRVDRTRGWLRRPVGRPGEGRGVSSSRQGRGRGAGGGPEWGAACLGLGPGRRTPTGPPKRGLPRSFTTSAFPPTTD